MKIYTRLVYDATGALLEGESHEHHGDVLLCKGGGDNEIKETAEEQELARIAAEQWNEYQSRFVPLENEFIQDVQMTSDDYAYAEGMGSTRVQGEASDAVKSYQKMLGQSGAQPGSGKSIGTMSSLAAITGRSGGQVVADAQQRTDDLHNRGLMSAVRIGRGQASDAQLGLTQVANDASRAGINDGNNRFMASAANQQAIGTAAGLGLRAYEEN